MLASMIYVATVDANPKDSSSMIIMHLEAIFFFRQVSEITGLAKIGSSLSLIGDLKNMETEPGKISYFVSSGKISPQFLFFLGDKPPDHL